MATATLPAPPARPVYVPQVQDLHRFTVAQYLQMVETGILGPDDHVELLEGWVVNKMSRNPPHDSAMTRINRSLVQVVPDDWLIRNQAALIQAYSTPEPDFAIVQGPEERYDDRQPGPIDVALLIEVADSSRLTDRRTKGSWYAEARIPEFWLVNLVDGFVEVYTQPRAGKSPAYRQRRNLLPGDELPLVLGGREIARLAVSAFFPGKV